jgi:predicted small lipoprotein YifL
VTPSSSPNGTRLVVLIAAALLCSCGQRGDLYFPEPEGETVAGVAGGAVTAPPLQDDDETETVTPPATGTPATPPANTGTNGAR